MSAQTDEGAGSDDVVERAVRAAAHRFPRLLLAVSGGRDSIVMLDAFLAVAPRAIAAVASFDHGTGAPATRAVAQVRSLCRARGIPFRSAHATTVARSEAAWRAARWSFLRYVARELRVPVATAHTRDDQVETVLMRVLRGAGARGLAGLEAPGPVVRPLLQVGRDDVAAHAAQRGVEWTDDPSNEDLRYLRNRVRHELLPALLRVRPALADELLAIGERAALLRRAIDEVAARLGTLDADGALCVATAGLAGYDPEALRLVWPALAARVSVTLDWRGTERLARFTKEAHTGDRMQLSGPVHVVRRRDAIAIGVPVHDAPESALLVPGLRWGQFSFRLVTDDTHDTGGSRWVAWLAADGEYVVRGWRPGDRMHGAGDSVPRRVKGFLRDAGLAGPDRSGWPVVLQGEEIVWIPGVRRSDAATVRPGRSGRIYACERNERRDRQHDG